MNVTKLQPLAFVVVVLVFVLSRLMGLPLFSSGLRDVEILSGMSGLALLSGEEVSWFLGGRAGDSGLLYSLFLSPFISIFGLSDGVVRAPMMLLSLMSIGAMPLLAAKSGCSIRRWLLIVILTSPWHVAASMWANGSLLLPYSILVALLFVGRMSSVLTGVIAASVILAISIFSTPVALVFSPLFLLGLIFILLIEHWSNIRLRYYLSGGMLLVGAASLLFWWSLVVSQGRLYILGIPAFDTQTLQTFKHHFLPLSHGGYPQIFDQIVGICRLLFGAYSDGVIEHGSTRWGGHYFILIPFLMFGGVRAINDGSIFDRLMLLWLVLGVISLSLFRHNMAALNLIWLPVIWLSALGLTSLNFNNYVRRFSLSVLIFIGLIFVVNHIVVTNVKIEKKYQSSLWAVIDGLNNLGAVEITSRAGSLRKEYFHAVYNSDQSSESSGKLLHISELANYVKSSPVSTVFLGEQDYVYLEDDGKDQLECHHNISRSKFKGEQDWGWLGIDAGVSAAAGSGLVVRKVKFLTGLGVHGTSQWSTELPPNAQTLNIGMSLADSATCSDGMTFSILLDGVPAYSKRLAQQDLVFVNLDVVGISELSLKTYGGIHKLCDHGAWLRPVLSHCM